MTTSWQERRPKRPDRYLDWELQNRPSAKDPEKERWCSVLIQLAPGPADRPMANLQALDDAIFDGQFPDGAGVQMHGDERVLLKSRIEKLTPGAPDLPGKDDVRLQFFVYMPEEGAYRDGLYAHRDFFTIRLVGPPIEGLEFRLDPRVIIPVPRPFLPRACIGVIDDGIAFAHERFRQPGERRAQSSRIAAIWLQDVERAEEPDLTIVFGRRLIDEDINELLTLSARQTGVIDEANVYRAIGAHDFSRGTHKATALRVAHGTHVMDLACGADPANQEEQDALQNISILVVQLPDAATADTTGVTMGSYVLQGLRQIILWADQIGEIPLVVNFSYGFTAGPKDGSHQLEREIARLVEHRNQNPRTPTVVVLPAGNSYRDRTTAKICLAPCQSETLDWILPPDDSTPSYVEIWCDVEDGAGAFPLEVTLTPPAGSAAPLAKDDPSQAQVLMAGGKPVCAVYRDIADAAGGRRCGRIFLAVNPTQSFNPDAPLAPCGRWTFSLRNASAKPLTARLYVQRDDTPSGFRRKGRQSFFDHPAAYQRDPVTGNYDALCPSGPITHEATLSAIGTGEHTILVGAAEDGDRRRPAEYTSSGPTPGKLAPRLSAIADDGPAFGGILAAGSTSSSVIAMRGTSVAAPQVTRALAIALRDQCGTIEEIIGQCTIPDPRLGCRVLPRRMASGPRMRKYYRHQGGGDSAKDEGT
jgi:hypothetical protein